MKRAEGHERELPTGELPERLLAQGLQELGIPAPPGRIDALVRFAAEIERWNPRCGLVKAGGRDLIVKHLLDSLAGLRHLQVLPRRDRIADAGSGAGLPGIPLSLFLPDSRFFLIERSEKRVGFLENAIVLLQLPNVRVIPEDIRSVRDRFDVVVLRAFEPLPNQWGNLAAITEQNGVVAAYKGRIEAIREEISRLEASAPEVKSSAVTIDVLPLRVPYLQAERHLVLIRRNA